MFLTLMVIGLVGLTAMALPALSHGHGALFGHGLRSGVTHGLSHAHAPPSVGQAHAPPSIASGRGAAQQILPAETHAASFLPSPRAVFSLLALYGAFGNACERALHLSSLHAALAAALPALLIEGLLVRPLWRMLFRVQGAECSPLDQLVLSEAEAVIPFRNGRGMISTVRDGRRVQLAAALREDQRHFTVKVGDKLVIEDVDAARERVTVTLPES